MQPQILVPLDGSALAEGVLTFAVALARLSASALVLLQVIPSAIALPSVGWRAFERRDIQPGVRGWIGTRGKRLEQALSIQLRRVHARAKR